MNLSRFDSRKRLTALSTLMTVMILMIVSVSVTAQDEAQDDETPRILQLLALVPDQAAFTAEDLIGFSDFRAAATRAGVTDYETWVDFQADLDAKERGAGRLLQSLPLSGFPNGQYLLMAGPEMPEIMGFDFFDIDAALTYGQPPAQVYLYQGEFDAGQIDTALTNNGYTSEDLAGFPYWCSEDGCDAGAVTNLALRNPANLFGGDLGRRFPVVLLEDTLVASPSDANLEIIVDVYQNEATSLADNPIYQTVVAAMYGRFANETSEEQPQLRQAYFVPPSAVGGSDPVVFLRMTPEQIERLREQFMDGDADLLPLYQLVALTDFGSSDYQFAQVVLVYTNEADAQTAAELIPQRLEDLDSLVSGESLQALFEARGAALLDPVVYSDEATGQYATVFTFQYAAAPETEEDDIPLQSGMVYRLLINMIYQRDMLWLASEIALPE